MKVTLDPQGEDDRITGTAEDGTRLLWDEGRGTWKPLFEGTKTEAAVIGAREELGATVEAMDWLDSTVNPIRRVVDTATKLTGLPNPYDRVGEAAADLIRSDDYEAARSTFPQAAGVGEAGVVAADLLTAGAAPVKAGVSTTGKVFNNRMGRIAAGEIKPNMVDRVGIKISGRSEQLRASADDARARLQAKAQAGDTQAQASLQRMSANDINAARAVEAERLEPVIGRRAVDPDIMETEYGFPLTPEQRVIISTTSPDEFAVARAADAEAELAARGRGRLTKVMEAAGAKDAPPNYALVAQQQQQAVNKAVLRAMGNYEDTQITRGIVGDQRKFMSEQFNDLYSMAQPTDPAVIRSIVDETNSAKFVPDDVKNVLERVADDAAKRAEKAGGTLTGNDIAAIRNGLQDKLQTALRGDPNIDRIDALSDVIERMDDLIEATLSKSEQTAMQNLRERWRVVKTVEEAAASTNARGDVNLKSFITSYRRRNKRFKIGYSDSPFDRFLDTAAAAMYRETPSSGTTEGISAVAKEVASEVVSSVIPGSGILMR